MDANGLRFWMLADAAHWPERAHTAWHAECGTLRLASERRLTAPIDPVAFAAANTALETIPRAVDIHDGVARWNGTARAIVVRSHLPGLATLPPTARWTGIMAYTPDGLPLVGALPNRDRQWVCAGWNGHGLALAPRSATLLSEVLLGRRAAAEVPGMFAPARFAANPAR